MEFQLRIDVFVPVRPVLLAGNHQFNYVRVPQHPTVYVPVPVPTVEEEGISHRIGMLRSSLRQWRQPDRLSIRPPLSWQDRPVIFRCRRVKRITMLLQQQPQLLQPQPLPPLMSAVWKRGRLLFHLRRLRPHSPELHRKTRTVETRPIMASRIQHSGWNRLANLILSRGNRWWLITLTRPKQGRSIIQQPTFVW